jgi:hypothetical protein
VAFAFTIATVAKALQPGWRITETLNGRNVMNFSVLSLDGTYRPASRAAVALTEDATTLFAGTIQEKQEQGLGGYGVTPIDTKCGAVDFNELPDRRQVELTIPAGSTLKDALVQVEGALATFGVTLDTLQVTGPTFTDPLLFSYGPLTQVLNTLSVVTGYAWEIDYTKTLRMFVPGVTSAAFSIGPTDGRVIGDITVRPSLSDYANRIIVRFSPAQRNARAFLVASAVIDGDEIYIGGPGWAGERVYVFKDTLSDVDGYVQVGATVADSLANLVAAINRTGAPGTQYANATAINEWVTAELRNESTMTATAIVPGDEGNGVLVAESSPNDMAWVVEGDVPTDSLQFGTELPTAGIAIADDVSEQASAGLVEKVIDRPDLIDLATAQAYADGELVRALSSTREVRYSTLLGGLRPGQKQQIVEPLRNLNAECLITQVDISAVGNVLRYEITAVEGLVIVPDYRDTFRTWSRSGNALSSAGAATGGGIAVTVLSSPVDLGGVDTAAIPMGNTPVYAPVWNAKPFFAKAALTGLVRVYLWGRSAGTVTARLYDLTSAVQVGTSVGVTDTARGNPVTFLVPIVAGHVYQLEIIGSAANVGVYGLGTLEAA